MDKERIVHALEELQNDDSKRSDVSRLEEIFDAVEVTFAKGISRQDVMATLNQHGFTFTLKRFENALYSVRKKRRQQAQAASVSTPPPIPSTAAPKAQALSPREAGQRFAAEVMSRPKTNPVLDALQRKRKTDENRSD